MKNKKVVICTNERKHEVDAKYGKCRFQIFQLYNNGSRMNEELYYVMLEVSDNSWEAREITNTEWVTLKDGMRFTIYPKASLSTRGMLLP